MRKKTLNNGFSAMVQAVGMASLILLVLATATMAWSQATQPNEPKSEKKKVTRKAAPTATVSEQQVSVDPQTKQIRPLTPEEARALLEGLRMPAGHAPGQVKVYQYPNGMLAAELPEEYMDAMVVKRGPDGKLTTECVKGTKAASERMRSKDPNAFRSGASTSSPKLEGKIAGKTSDKVTPSPNLEEKE